LPRVFSSRRSRALVLLLAPLLLAAAEARWIVLNRAAKAALDARDYTALRTALTELQPLLPGNPRVAYSLACANAKVGNGAAALDSLRRLAGMGLVYDVAADDDFASLRTSPEFIALVSRMAENRKPVARASLVLDLPGADLIPEDIAFDLLSRRFFVCSVRRGIVLTGDGKPFAVAPWSILALRIDPGRHLLWAATGWTPYCERCSASDKDKTALLAFDLDTGTPRRRIDSPVKGLLGDMTISREGDLYVSEGLNGALLRLRSGSDRLERLDTAGEFPSPQTPALSADEKTLYIPDYVRGIAAMSLSDRSVQWLQPAANLALSGIDGLYLCRGSFIAVQNGTTPPRIVRFSLDLQQQEILVANTPWLGEPTHGTVVDDEFFFLANTGWELWEDNGRKKPRAAPARSSIRVQMLRPAE
jgi:hypothetical protein